MSEGAIFLLGLGLGAGFIIFVLFLLGTSES